MKKNVLDEISSAVDRRDERANVQLAEKIVQTKDAESIAQLIAGTQTTQTRIQNDCIKVLYEIGERQPKLIASYKELFVLLLTHKNNRLQWGAMTALATIVFEDPGFIIRSLPKIMYAVEHGSVITRDASMRILLKLSTLPRYADKAFALFDAQLRTCPTNQLPMYAENAQSRITPKNIDRFLKTLVSRLDAIPQASKRKRVEKVIRTLTRVTEKKKK